MNLKHLLILASLLFVVGGSRADDGETVPTENQSVVPEGYFESLTDELRKTWPKNRTVRLVFHGHSVPAGYFKTPVVRRFDSYPGLAHAALCEKYPTAVIDVCVTAIGGEVSEQGAKRFASDVLSLKPDVVFIDYGLNDRLIGLDRAETAWRSMIKQCLENQVLAVLLTPTPDSTENILDHDAPLMQHTRLVRRLAAEFEIPVVDSYAAFQRLVSDGNSAEQYLSQFNHPNREGHTVVADLIIEAITTRQTSAQ